MRPDGTPAPAVSNPSPESRRQVSRPPRLRWVAALWCLLATLPAAAAETCAPSRIDARAHVAYVYDGDTVRLDDGRHVRFIGIDTPEIGHHGKPSQPFAVAARNALIRLLKVHGNRVSLAYGRERFDKYHRVLAHIYVDGDSVEAGLLERGLATVLIVPPNVGHAACYQAAEQAARERRRGIWHHPKYRVTPVEALGVRPRGYHIISGRVTRVAHSAHAVWVHLGPRVELRIDNRDLPYLKPLDPDTLLHKRVIARGWLHHHRRGGLWMRVRHRSALHTVLPGAP